MGKRPGTSCEPEINRPTKVNRIRRIAVVMLMCLSLLLAGCDPDTGRYYGDYPEAYTVAINNLIGAYGNWNTILGLIEEDHYGRSMYYYWNAADEIITDDKLESNMPIARGSVLIYQKTDSSLVYFYPDYNFISFPVDSSWDMETLEKGLTNKDYCDRILQAVSEDDLERLKTLNDWNKPIDERKCISLEIGYENKDRRVQGGLVNESQIEEFYSKIHPVEAHCLDSIYLTTDDYNRHIYFVRDIDSDYNFTEPYVMLFNPDGSYNTATGYMELTDLYNYQDALKAFKEQNSWNKPL